MHVSRLLLLCLALGTAGCPLGVTSSTAFPCADHSDCRTGYLCSPDAVCAPEDDVRDVLDLDGGEVALDGGEPEPTPTPTPEDAGPPTQEPPTFGPEQLIVCDEGETCTIDVVVVDPDTPAELLRLDVDSVPTKGTLDIDGMQVRYVPDEGAIGGDAFALRVTDDAGRSAVGVFNLVVVRRHTCQTLRTTSDGLLSTGVYAIDPDGQGRMEAFCWMDGDDGWTLVLKADGTQPTFAYDAPLWESAELLQPDALDLSSSESKTEAFVRHPIDAVRVVMSAPNAGSFDDVTASVGAQTLDINVDAHSMRELMMRGTHATTLGTSSWTELMPDAQLQQRCALEGFNVDLRWWGDSDHYRYRIGVIADEGDWCDAPDSGLGVGGEGTACDGQRVVVGNAANCLEGNRPAQHLRAFAAVFVKAVERVDVAGTCAVHKQLQPDAEDGLYYVDNGDPNLVQQVHCNMSVDGGGWTLVGRSADDGRRPFGWGSRTGSAAVTSRYYALDAVRMGFHPTEILVAMGDGDSNDVDNVAYKWPRAGDALPGDLLQSYGDARHDATNVQQVQGNCQPNDRRAFRYIGHVDDEWRFFFDNDNWYSERGLEQDGFRLAGSDNSCGDNGRLDNDHGLIFVR